MAVDWHMSTLIKPGIIKVVGASPPFVLMPEMGSVQSLQIRTPPKSIMQVCGVYKSDTHYEGKNRAPILGRDGTQGVSATVHEIELEKANMEREARAKYSQDGLTTPNSRFTAFDKPLSWTSASAFCKSRGKRLATIEDENENKQATALAQQACGHTRSHLRMGSLCVDRAQ